ncbi:hypothetical protein JMN32_24350 [Fulvivirga sp. 29W222]|uniref:Uncharacterized protein n=1 Tax=Fulvivirga marina TaxID=2494733 RepID=A0A937G395_9BACT|nr:hypothetical protein [Fulvivirga marina]MBL6449466.1 hypothetical protein [Fulvivirga marina]
MQIIEKKPHQQFRTLKLIYASMAVAIALFALAVLTINYVQLMQPTLSEEQDFRIFIYISAALVILSMPMSMILFGQSIKGIKWNECSLTEKLALYQTALIIRGAILEFPALFVCVTVLLTGNLLALLLIPMVLFIFFITKPSLYRLGSDLELTRDEIEQLKG